MNSAHQTSFEPNAVPHPGETVVEYLEFYGWSQRDLARRTGLAPKTISEICNGKAPVTPTTALAFEKAFERPAHLWLNLQRHFDEAEARNQESARHFQWTDWAQRFQIWNSMDGRSVTLRGALDLLRRPLVRSAMGKLLLRLQLRSHSKRHSNVLRTYG